MDNKIRSSKDKLEKNIDKKPKKLETKILTTIIEESKKKTKEMFTKPLQQHKKENDKSMLTDTEKMFRRFIQQRQKNCMYINLNWIHQNKNYSAKTSTRY